MERSQQKQRLFFTVPSSALLLIVAVLFLTSPAQAHSSHEPTTDTTELASSFYDELGNFGDNALMFDEDEITSGTEVTMSGNNGRSLLWWKRLIHYYISYGALSANRIPCPPRSGRSYYTHNCYSARGPVHPYTRGCSAITRCRR